MPNCSARQVDILTLRKLLGAAPRRPRTAITALPREGAPGRLRSAGRATHSAGDTAHDRPGIQLSARIFPGEELRLCSAYGDPGLVAKHSQ